MATKLEKGYNYPSKASPARRKATHHRLPCFPFDDRFDGVRIMKIISRKEAKSLGLTYYFTGKPCKRGHVAARLSSSANCVECKSILSSSDSYKEQKKKYQKEYYRKNISKQAEYHKNYRSKNREVLREKQKIFRKQNPFSVKSSKEKGYQRRLDQLKSRRCNDPFFAIKCRLRCRVYAAFRRNGYAKSSKTAAILGCDWDALKNHIERQFIKGMTWENRSEWHIDHIVPLASAKTEEELIALNHYTNLRPMWAEDNLYKSAKMEFLI